MMVKQSYTVRFVTPAFLGNAEQQGQWRTPPFKALLRQWWRVAAAKDHGYNHERLREAEGKLFGNAWIENNFCKSKVRLRLDRWDEGKLKQSVWPGKDEKKLTHPEVTNKDGKTIPVGAELYLGYGPLNYDKIQKRTVLKANAAIQADDHAELHLAYPEDLTVIADVFQLIHWFGTVGGRSRNGWGSLMMDDQDFELPAKNHKILQGITRPLADCMRLDWPHALGSDQHGLLIWKSREPAGGWREAMTDLAKVKIAFRTALHFDPTRHHRINQRHLLGYPVTHHNFNPWGNQARLANQLRFKVTKTAQGKYLGLVYHLPCAIPGELLNTLEIADRTWIVGQQLDVWRSVHGILDKQMQRIQ